MHAPILGRANIGGEGAGRGAIDPVYTMRGRAAATAVRLRRHPGCEGRITVRVVDGRVLDRQLRLESFRKRRRDLRVADRLPYRDQEAEQAEADPQRDGPGEELPAEGFHRVYPHTASTAAAAAAGRGATTRAGRSAFARRSSTSK